VRTAVIILGHGSRNSKADDSLREIAAEVRRLRTYGIVERAFLQHTAPSLQDALNNCIRQKAERIVIVPFFMQAGSHVSRDIPVLAEKAKKQHPGIDIVVTDYAGAHPHMAKIVVDLIGEEK
jgi:sirohydrochlorin ferrochelatase